MTTRFEPNVTEYLLRLHDAALVLSGVVANRLQEITALMAMAATPETLLELAAERSALADERAILRASYGYAENKLVASGVRPPVVSLTTARKLGEV